MVDGDGRGKEIVRWKRDLVAAADSLASFLGLRILHFVLSVDIVQRIAARRLPAHLERTTHGGYSYISVSPMLGMAVLSPARLLVQHRVHESDGALLATRTDARIRTGTSPGVGGAPTSRTIAYEGTGEFVGL